MKNRRMEFEAKLEPGGEKDAWVLMNIPFNVQETFGNRARVAVKGTINGFRYQSSIKPDYFIHICYIEDQ